MEAIPLAHEDLAILALESDTVAGHTCKVVLLGPGAPDAAALRTSISERLDRAPALTRRLGGSASAPAWVPDESLDLAAHVVDVAPEPGGVQPTVAKLFEQRLDRARPLWHLAVVPLEHGGAVLVWRIHHALADGTAAMRFARAVLWDEQPEAAVDHPHAAAADDLRRRGHLAGFLDREFARTHNRSPFDARIGTRRTVAFARTSLAQLHDAARSLAGATVNDAVLATVAGGLRRWVEHHHGTLGNVRVRVPVSLHHEGDDASNRDSFFSLALPLNEPEPVERLRRVRAETAVRKADHDAETMDALLRGLARVSPRLEHFCERLEASPRRFAVNVSNVPGPRTAISVLGVPVEGLYSIAEIGERHALRVAVVSAADTLCFGLCADPAIVDDLQAMAEGLEAEAAALVAASA